MRCTWLLALAVALSSGCYFAVQRTSYVMQTEELDPEDGTPSTDMSMASNLYEVAGGFTAWSADVFAGFGGGAKRVHQRSADDATEPDEIGGTMRYFLGAAITAFQTERFRLRPYGIISGGFSFLSDDFEDEFGVIDSRVTRGWEAGLEIALDMVRDEDVVGTGSVFLRFGYARMEGKTAEDFFGSTEWDGNALLASFGFALSGVELF